MTVQSETKQLRRQQPSAQETLRCDWERPSAVAREVDQLSKRWAIELGQRPFEPDWERIFALDRANGALVWTARTAHGTLTGYLFVTFNRAMFTNANFARIEAGYLAPEWRSGPVGLRYIKSAVQAIKRLNGFSIEWETNDAFEPDAHGRSRLATLLERLNFEQVGTCMRLR